MYKDWKSSFERKRPGYEMQLGWSLDEKFLFSMNGIKIKVDVMGFSLEIWKYMQKLCEFLIITLYSCPSKICIYSLWEYQECKFWEQWCQDIWIVFLWNLNRWFLLSLCSFFLFYYEKMMVKESSIDEWNMSLGKKARVSGKHLYEL